jgi:molybdate transport system substrate-binding protein
MADVPSIAVVSSLALKGVLEEFRPAFERRLASRLDLRFDATQAILAQIQGLRADLLVLTAEALEELRNSGTVAQVRSLGSSGVGIAVRAGAPKPDIGSVDALKRALGAASSVAHSKVGASGLYFAELLPRLGVNLRKRIVVEKGPVGLVVAAGEAELGVQQLCELAPVPGIDILGPLPDPLQRLTHFAAGIPLNAANPNGALALMQLLRSDKARAGMVKGGMQPAP